MVKKVSVKAYTRDYPKKSVVVSKKKTNIYVKRAIKYMREKGYYGLISEEYLIKQEARKVTWKDLKKHLDWIIMEDKK